jgi:hypothetical protein
MKKIQINRALRILLASISFVGVSCSDKSLETAEIKNLHKVKSVNVAPRIPENVGPSISENAGLREVENWGPRETPKGKKFNIQPNGLSAGWIKVKGVSRHPKTHILFGQVVIGGRDLSITETGVSFFVRDALIQKAGSYEVAIIEGDTSRKIVVGEFKVK